MKERLKEVNKVIQEANEVKKIIETDFLQFVGENIKNKRIKKGLTQDELSERISIGRTSVTNIESGRQDTTITTLLHIAMVLDCEPSELLTF